MDRDNMIQGHKGILILHKNNEILLFTATWIKLETVSQLNRS